jgi:hypothetical protein
MRAADSTWTITVIANISSQRLFVRWYIGALDTHSMFDLAVASGDLKEDVVLFEVHGVRTDELSKHSELMERLERLVREGSFVAQRSFKANHLSLVKN